MNRVFMAIASTSMALVGAQALTDVSVSQSRMPRRQMAACMVKRMSADRLMSYNEAVKACKMTTDNLASNTPIKPIDGR